jgi:hypothetical protein
LVAYRPYTSKDIDYFGGRAAAQKLADASGGALRLPHGDDHTPQTAIVSATIAGLDIDIDFLWHVKGVDAKSLEKQAIEIKLSVRLGGKIGELRFRSCTRFTACRADLPMLWNSTAIRTCPDGNLRHRRSYCANISTRS